MGKRQAFLIMMNQEEVIEDLTDEELGKIFRSIFKYERTKEIPKFDDRYLNSVFKSFKTQIDFSEENYNKICEKNRQNVNKRWNKSDTIAYDCIQLDTSEYERSISHAKNAKIREDKIREDKIREDKIREDKIREDNNKVADATPTPPFIFDLPVVLNFGLNKGATEEYCKKFYEYYKNKGKKWGGEKEWQEKFDEWCKKDNIEQSVYQLKKIGDGVFQI